MVAVDLGEGTRAAEVVAAAVSQDSSAIDFLVLSAGIFIDGDLTRMTSDAYAMTMAVNLNANVYLCQKLVPALRNGTKPRILIIGSTSGLEAYPLGSSYSVAKWGLRGFAVNLRRELMDDRVGVTLLNPGATLTDMWEGEQVDTNRLLAPEDVATMASVILELSEQAVVEEITMRPMLGKVHE
jgi:short-subunit dehydrogenase